MRIAIGAPANGAVLKESLRTHLDADRRVDAIADLSTPEVTYPAVSIAVARAVADGKADRGLLVCGTGIRAATAHDLLGVRGAVENYDAQILCMGQNVIAAPKAIALVDVWLDARHDPASAYHPKLAEIEALEAHGCPAAPSD